MDPIKRFGRSFLSVLSVSGRSKMPQKANAAMNAREEESKYPAYCLIFKDKLYRGTAKTLNSQMAPTHGRHGWILNVSTDRTLSASLAFAASQLARSRDQYGRLNGMPTMARLPAAGTSPGPKWQIQNFQHPRTRSIKPPHPYRLTIQCFILIYRRNVLFNLNN